MQLIDRIQHHAADAPRSLAIRNAEDGAACTYGELARRVEAMAALLRQRLPRGAVVVLKCPNSPDFWVAYFAVLAAEMSVFPVPPDLALPELIRAADRASAAAILIEPALPRPESFALEALAGDMSLLTLALFRRPGDAAPQPGAGLLLQSSGTTGEPKIVWRSGQSLDAMAQMLVEGVGFGRTDGVLSGIPLGHSYGGEHGILGPAFGGSAVHVCNGLNLAVLSRELAGGHITILPGVPFLFEIMSKAADITASTHSLRQVYSAGATLPASVQQAFRSRFGSGIGQVYGATEVGSVTFGDAAAVASNPFCVGYPLPGAQVSVIARGEHPTSNCELAVHSPAMLSHLVGSNTDWQPGTPWPTGDLGHLTEDGAVVLTGRLRLLIDVGGRKVNPIEVEQIIRQHPAVADCVVVAARVSETVSRLRAVLECRPGHAPGDQEIRTFVAQHLTAYKVPRLVEFWPKLPRTALGKVLRQQVEAST